MNEIQLNGHSGVVKLPKQADPPPKLQVTASEVSQAPSAPSVAQSASSVNNISDVSNRSVVAKEEAKKAQAESDAKDARAVKEAVTKLNDFIQNSQRDLRFRLDKASGKTVITVLDRKTHEVIRQIPDDLALKMAQSLHQDEPLTLFNAKV
jgi:flagellar protein FlaG